MMSEVIFNEKDKQPTSELLLKKLGDVHKYWIEIKEYVNDLVGRSTDEWKFYGKKYGWQLKTLYKKRNLFFLIPYDRQFKIVLIFGDKAVAEIEKSKISGPIIKDIVNAKKYMEGRGIGIDVVDGKNMADIKMLINLKIQI